MIFKDNYFLGKRFLITGASGGIGSDITISLINLGASVIAISKNFESLQILREKIAHKDRFIPICEDMSKCHNLREFAFNINREHEIDGAVFCAGVLKILPFSRASFQNSLDIFSINYFGNFEILKGLLDRRGRLKFGASFVFISSNSSIKAYKGLSDYAATKGAINTAIKSIALEIAPKYRVNAISPGIVNTNMTNAIESLEYISKDYPCGLGDVSYITPLCLFLLSDDSFYITGENITIDGGASL